MNDNWGAVMTYRRFTLVCMGESGSRRTTFLHKLQTLLDSEAFDDEHQTITWIGHPNEHTITIQVEEERHNAVSEKVPEPKV